MTSESIYAADQLFATLDPTLRKLAISDSNSVILADTVGFIRHLPHDLIAAFRATLVETREADLILHVVDCADDSREEKIEAVNRVLKDVGAADVPQLMVYNKIDLPGYKARIDHDEENNPWKIWLSAQNGEGFDELMTVLNQRFTESSLRCRLSLRPHEGRIRAYLFEEGAIETENYENNGDITLDLLISPSLLKRLNRKFVLPQDRVTMLTDTLAGAA